MPKVVRLPGRRAASLNPASFAPEFDMVSELTHRRYDYTSKDSWLAIYQFPGYLRTNLDRIRATVNPKPGLSSTVACAIYGGVEVLAKHSDIQALIALRERLDTVQGVDAVMAEEVAGWFRRSPLGLPGSCDSQRQNLTVPEPIKKTLHALASEIGMSFSSLALVACVVSVSNQKATFPQHAQQMSRSLERFLCRVRCRRVLSQVLLDTLETTP